MAWRNWLGWLPGGKWTADGKNPDTGEPLIIEIPADAYYKEMALYTAVSLISNAVSRSEVKTYEGGKAVKGRDYYLLNVAPNRGETSSYFWHRVVNEMVRHGEALIVEAGGYLYCADSFTREQERPVLGDTYSNVTVGNYTFDKIFTQSNACVVRLDNIRVRQIVDGLYDSYGKILSSAAAAIKASSGRRYRLKIDSVQAGDESFNKLFEESIKRQLQSYLKSDNAVYPQFDGYELISDHDSRPESRTVAKDYIDLKREAERTVCAALHIPESIFSGNINGFRDVVSSFLTFAVDPIADAITEALNKTGGDREFARGNYVRVDTSGVMHTSLWDAAAAVSTLLSSGVLSVDELRTELGREPLNTKWSTRHWMTRNFAPVEEVLAGADEHENGGTEA